MPRKPRPTQAGLYHVASGATRPDPFFRDDVDRGIFVVELAAMLAREDVVCVAFCVLTTHYHLILNAADATHGRGRIDVSLRRRDEVAVLEVQDNGPGVPAERRGAIFEAFYSSKPHGTGLGLLTVKVTAEEHGGTVEVLDSELGGACFRVTLPRQGRGNPDPLD